jgi:hypothetical protein
MMSTKLREALGRKIGSKLLSRTDVVMRKESTHVFMADFPDGRWV